MLGSVKSAKMQLMSGRSIRSKYRAAVLSILKNAFSRFQEIKFMRISNLLGLEKIKLEIKISSIRRMTDYGMQPCAGRSSSAKALMSGYA
jgi:hypothetical protein